MPRPIHVVVGADEGIRIKVNPADTSSSPMTLIGMTCMASACLTLEQWLSRLEKAHPLETAADCRLQIACSHADAILLSRSFPSVCAPLPSLINVVVASRTLLWTSILPPSSPPIAVLPVVPGRAFLRYLRSQRISIPRRAPGVSSCPCSYEYTTSLYSLFTLPPLAVVA